MSNIKIKLPDKYKHLKNYTVRLTLFNPDGEIRYEEWRDFCEYPDFRHERNCSLRPMAYENVLQVLPVKVQQMAESMARGLKAKDSCVPTNIKIKLPDKYKHLMDNPGVRDWIKECEHRLNEEFSSEKLQKMSDDFSKASLFGTTYIEIMDGRYIVYPKHRGKGIGKI